MKPATAINVKILSLGEPERYSVRRLVVWAQQELLKTLPHLELKITEVNKAVEIGKYAQVLVLPTLVINEKVVCSGRYPNREEVFIWIRDAIGIN